MADKSRVARYQADRTNQKFYFCRMACQQADSTADKQQYQAHCETAIFHLYGAYLAFLQELANYYNLDSQTPTATYIQEQLLQKTLVSPEIMRLEQSLDKGVLANINKAYQRCLYAPAPDSDSILTNETSADLIVNVVTLSNQWLPDDQTIRAWRQDLMAVVDELRSGMAEY